MIDTHAHMNLAEYEDDRGETLERARAAGVRGIVNIGIDEATSRECLDLAGKGAGDLYATVGLHPNSAAGAGDLNWIEALTDHPRVVGVGETGLDFYRDRATPVEQERAFDRQIEIARRKELTLIVHVREAEERVLSMLEAVEGVLGVWHCFSGTLDHARRALDLGLFLGIGGPVTFKRSDRRELLAQIPRDRVVLETDCPFLAPHPHRGRRNEPAYLRLIRESVAESWGVSEEEVDRLTDSAATALFRRDLASSAESSGG